MRVRYLSLQGFKTFASRTVFRFEEGITAIVGPNGSGKSNLADALRWVLGEQSYSALRSRRTEDVIFSGSSTRAPVGMAEVSLLLDNSDGYLPVDFAEVEITRRAYRSGLNEYFLNRRKVRLQDIEEVLGGLNSSYVVIHQGLVDEALSLRPRERRLLLEEVAEVRRYHERRQKAEQQLSETEANMVRIADLRSELVPRLRALERQSQHARERAQLEATLQQALRGWYHLQWEDASRALERASREESAARAAVEAARSACAEQMRRLEQLRAAAQQFFRAQEERRLKEAALRQQEAELARLQARIDGERRALERQLRDLLAELARQRQDTAAREERRAQLLAEKDALAQRLEALRRELEEREAACRAAQEALAAREKEHRELAERVAAGSRRRTETARRAEVIGARLAALAEEESERQRFLAEIEARAAEAEAEGERLAAQLAELRERRDALEQKRAAQTARLRRAQEAAQQAAQAAAEARARRDEARLQLDALARMASSADARAFLEGWCREKGLAPFRPLFSRLQVPPGLEAALEAALGAELAPFAVASSDDALAALKALREAEAGRAWLVPPEERSTSKSSPSLPLPPLLEQLSFPEEDRAAWTALLGHVLFAQEAETAWDRARALPEGWCVVTADGTLVTAGGAISGGHLPSRASAWVLERERRRWQQVLEEAEALLAEAEARATRAASEATEGNAALAALETELRTVSRALEETAARAGAMERERERRKDELARHQARLEALRTERAQCEAELHELEASLAQLQAEEAALEAVLAERRRDLREAQEALFRAQEQLREVQTAWAVARKEQENLQALEEMLQRDLQQASQQVATGELLREQLLARLRSLQGRAEALRQELARLGVALGEVVWAPLPAAVEPETLAREEAEAARMREALLEAEAALQRAEMEVRLQRDRLREVLRRGLAEVGPEASAYGPAGEALLGALLENPPEWARAPLPEGVTAEEMERRVALLREEIRRCGPVNPLAEEEYRQTQERYDFLGQQLQDLQDAARALRQLIAELDRTMEERFQETFAAINREFQAYFARLFGGGTASLRLVRLEEENGGLASLGVEIVARPPGKRAHTLSLLSGGERALTSAALLFAILKVNPRPFCLLDEVDAMLDEANVGRFRECLEELAAQTQFIVITHNRGTIEAARTLYGVSLAEDGTSRVLSLRLEEIPAAPGR